MKEPMVAVVPGKAESVDAGLLHWNLQEVI